MNFVETTLEGCYVIEIEKISDDRGFFARSWDKKVFEKNGLDSNLVQCNISFNKKKGTLRGMHFQKPPFSETKLVRCTRGKIFDVIIDLRKDSNTYKKWFSIELSAVNHKMLYIPEGFAHGFQTLEDNSEVFYQMSKIYNSEYAQGILWNDTAFNLEWPLDVSNMSEKDKNFPSFND
ncbi:dTDP-4-dehydrorhamnose 3,5-epimerase [Nitrosopumilus sp. S4]